jgi:shikimate dehydrogenase
MHNAALAALNLNWRYLAFDVPPDELRPAINGAKAMRFIGLNLTVPHKLLALDLVDTLDDSARRWGAVNTIRFEAKDPRGQWRPLAEFPEPPPEIRSHGFNTDADALVRSLREELGLELNGKKVLLLGAGGAGRAAALKLALDHDLELFLVNRTVAKSQALADELRNLKAPSRVTVGYPTGPVELVLNATSLGLQPTDSLPFDAARFSLNRTAAVYDMIYRPAETPLLKAAKAAACRTANGLGMLLYQGAKALEIWTGQPAPLDIMRRALEQNVYG